MALRSALGANQHNGTRNLAVATIRLFKHPLPGRQRRNAAHGLAMRMRECDNPTECAVGPVGPLDCDRP